MKVKTNLSFQFLADRAHLKYCIYPYIAEIAEKVDSILVRTVEYGFTKFYGEYSQNLYQIYFQSHVTEPGNRLTYAPVLLKNLKLYLYCYCFGVALSLIVFLLEIFIGKKLAEQISGRMKIALANIRPYFTRFHVFLRRVYVDFLNLAAS